MPVYQAGVQQQSCPREQHRGRVCASDTQKIGLIGKREVVKTPYKLKKISTFGEVQIMTSLGESPFSALVRHQAISKEAQFQTF